MLPELSSVSLADGAYNITYATVDANRRENTFRMTHLEES